MHICIGNNTPKAPNPMGCIYDSGISNPFNQLLYLVLCICVKNDPLVVKYILLAPQMLVICIRFYARIRKFLCRF